MDKAPFYSENRAYVDTLLSSMGLSINRPFDIIRVSSGLSLNDCYWLKSESNNNDFDSVNLYDNKFSRILGQIAFTGYGSGNASGLTSSPEFTTNGILPKCWRREKGKILLYKGGTQGASNTGNEPYSEFYAYQIAKILGVDAIPYSISKWKVYCVQPANCLQARMFHLYRWEESFVPEE